MPAVTRIRGEELLQVFPYPLKKELFSLGKTLTYYDRAGDPVFRDFQGREMLISDLEMRALNLSVIKKKKLPTRDLVDTVQETGKKLSYKPGPVTAYWVKLSSGKAYKVRPQVFTYLSFLALDGYVTFEELEHAVHGREMSRGFLGSVRWYMKKAGVRVTARRNSRDRNQSGIYIGSVADLGKYRKEHQFKRMGVTYNTLTGYVRIGTRKPKVLPDRGITMLDAILSHGRAGISRKVLYEQIYETTGKSDALIDNLKVQKFLTNVALGGNYIQIIEGRYYFNAPKHK